MNSKLIHFKGIDAYVLFEKLNGINIPKKICFKKNSIILITIELDAIDGMLFSAMGTLAILTLKEQIHLFECLAIVLRIFLGGKCLFAVENNYLGLAKEILQFDITPDLPITLTKDYQFFQNVMFSKNEESILQKKLAQNASKISKLEMEYSLISDLTLLNQLAKPISDLFIQHTDWAGATEENRKVYSELGIKHRVQNPAVMRYTIVNKNDHSVVGFVRRYHYSLAKKNTSFYYISDLVIRTDKRKQGLATFLLSKILVKNENTFLIAGNPNLISMYKVFGFKKVSGAAPISLTRGHTLLCGILPTQSILKNYIDSLSTFI